MKKILSVLICAAMAASMLVGCGSSGDKGESKNTSVEETNSKAEEKEGGTEPETEAATEGAKTTYSELDLNPSEALSVSSEGVKAAAPSEFTLTDEEIQKLKDGKYTAAFCYHTQSDTCNQTKLASATALLKEWGIEVVSVTDANFDAATQTSQIESTMALQPDVLFVMPYDPDATASALDTNIKGTDTKLVFMENVATGYVAGTDYAGCASSDSYGNGKACADILAKQLDYKGNVAMMVYDLVYYVTNERDRGFRETIENDYPDIKIVTEEGFTDPSNTGTVADAILAKYPDLNGIYASWDIPAEGAISSAASLGRDDLIITCCDLGDTAAKSIAEEGMIRGSGAPRSPQQGESEALIAAYALLGKEMPSTFVTPPALPVVKANVLDAYKASYGIDAPDWLFKLAK
ncbi:substrate-binding domain-containing protein [Lachnospiraceae bacterium ZAX-1]